MTYELKVGDHVTHKISYGINMRVVAITDHDAIREFKGVGTGGTGIEALVEWFDKNDCYHRKHFNPLDLILTVRVEDTVYEESRISSRRVG